jgi:hypothetical protein
MGDKSMSHSAVQETISKSAEEMKPDYSVMGYMARDERSKRVPTIHFIIFRKGKIPAIDNLTGLGIVCPLQGGKQVCIRERMIN